MARPPYKIIKGDFSAAKQYIRNAMDRGEVSNVVGWVEFRNASTPEGLQKWCDAYLILDVWKKLKKAIIAARKRSRDYKTSRQAIRVDLNQRAWKTLSTLATEEKHTLSDMIILMEDVYRVAKQQGIYADENLLLQNIKRKINVTD